ncbi:MAG: hypothetical protein HZB83_08455 [Deltaproteobacteria bacterium]|nr:hypothetical protein [Deltaproteobacteria bacterium]
MTRKITVIAAVVFLLLAGFAASYAVASNDESQIENDASTIGKDAKADGGKVVTQRIEKEFNVDEARVSSLRAQKLGYGEIAIVLALAQKLPGGITDANVNTIISKWQGPPREGWGKIAKDLGLNLGTVLSQIEKVKNASDNGAERGQKPDKSEVSRADRPERVETPGRLDRPSVPDRPIRPEIPQRSGR